MKKLFIFLCLLFISEVVSAQVYKLRSTSLSIRYKEGSISKTKWSEPEEASVLIVLNVDKDRVNIYSKEPQEYDIIKAYDKTTDSDGDDIYRFVCIDQDGVKCTMRFVRLNSRNGRLQLYIDYSNISWLYNVRVNE